MQKQHRRPIGRSGFGIGDIEQTGPDLLERCKECAVDASRFGSEACALFTGKSPSGAAAAVMAAAAIRRRRKVSTEWSIIWISIV